MTRNRLTDSISPFLERYAGSPIHWQPWDAEAIALARALDRPILLSVGHATCQSCSAMARDSFADPRVATLLNESFVCIGVDREERPDLDRVYQLALSLLTRGAGGWPLTLFLDPTTLVPFFGGTFFPRSAGHGLPGFIDLILRVREIFAERRAELDEQCGKVAELLAELDPGMPPAPRIADNVLLTNARDELAADYDPAEGGFGTGAKWPMPSALERLLLTWAASRRGGEVNRETLEMVMHTLTRMARGGIFDHIGGGFFSHTIDRKWLTPHFEKRLAENGALLAVYADACSVSSDELFRDVLTGTVDWLLREMQLEGGAFRAAAAATDPLASTHYLWRREELRRLLSDDEYLVIETLYGIDKPANFENRWILNRRDAWRAVVERLSLERPNADRLLASGRQKLLEARSGRPTITHDDRVLAQANGMAIKGLARAGLVVGEDRWLDAAQSAVDFIASELWRDGVLYSSLTDNTLGPAGYLDDYANVLDGLVTLLRARWREVDARLAVDLADALCRTFEDREHGGFFLTRHDGPVLIYRPKPTLDDALPSGNGVAARVLLELGHLFGRRDYLESGSRALAWARGHLEQFPSNHAALLAALEYQLVIPEQVIVRGTPEGVADWLAGARSVSRFNPWQNVYGIPYGPFRTLPACLPKLVTATQQQTTAAWFCRDLACEAPITDLEVFRTRLAR